MKQIPEQMKADELYCRIWVIEQDPRNGTAHWCHAERKGLEGGLYPKNIINRILDEKPTNLETMRGVLVRCKPGHDGSACDSCQYKPHIDAPGYFHD